VALASEPTGEYVLLPGNKARPLPRTQQRAQRRCSDDGYHAAVKRSIYMSWPKVSLSRSSVRLSMCVRLHGLGCLMCAAPAGGDKEGGSLRPCLLSRLAGALSTQAQCRRRPSVRCPSTSCAYTGATC
jgi:ribosomal protein S14